jgi:hypothetical protein
MVSVAIVCEGNDDKAFFKTLISHLGFKEKHVGFYVFHGKSNIFKSNDKRYADLKLDVENGQIENVLFVVDADDVKNDIVYGGFENTQTALNNVIKQLDFEEIAHTYVMCDPETKTGYLEPLILPTISEPQRNCIEGFLKCSQFKSKENHKAILNQIYKLAYPNAPYDFQHPHFEPLKTELTNLFKYRGLR